MSILASCRAAASIVVLALVTTSCTGSAAAPATNPSETTTSPTGAASGVDRTSDGGQVTVVASWDGTASGAVFHLKLDTHAVDLDDLDLADAVVRNDRGQTLSGASWAAPKGGHHREGVLTFGGDSVRFFSGASWIELVIRGVGDLPERTLRWEVRA